MKLLLLQRDWKCNLYQGVLWCLQEGVLQTSLYFLLEPGHSQEQNEEYSLSAQQSPGLCPTMSFSLVLRPPQLLQLATICLTGPDTPVTHFSPDVSSGLHVQYLAGRVAPPSRGGEEGPGCLSHRLLKGPLDNQCVGGWGMQMKKTRITQRCRDPTFSLAKLECVEEWPIFCWQFSGMLVSGPFPLLHENIHLNLDSG